MKVRVFIIMMKSSRCSAERPTRTLPECSFLQVVRFNYADVSVWNFCKNAEKCAPLVLSQNFEQIQYKGETRINRRYLVFTFLIVGESRMAGFRF